MSLMSSFLWWRCMWTAWPMTPIWWRTTGQSTRLRLMYSSPSEPAGKVSGWSHGWNMNAEYKHRENGEEWIKLFIVGFYKQLTCFSGQRTCLSDSVSTLKIIRCLPGILRTWSVKVTCSLHSMCVRFILTDIVLLCSILSNGSNFEYSCMNRSRQFLTSWSM